MIINPQYILDQGIIKLPAHIDKAQVIQPNGIDLYINEIFQLVSGDVAQIGDQVNTVHRKTQKLLAMHGGRYLLEAQKAYKVETGYEINIPKDMAAYIMTRSSLNRNGVLVGSGLWDSGFQGFVGTTVYPTLNIELFDPCRIAQIVFMSADSNYLYKGQYNGK